MPLSPGRATPPSAPQPDGPYPSTGGTIFIIDDDDAVRDALAMALAAAGHAVAAFASARQFLDAYRGGDPGCLVVEMDLPDGGALELLRRLAAESVVPPAVVVSRRLRRRTLPGDLTPGSVLFLDKPFGIDELLHLIAKAMATGPAGRSAG